MEIILKFALGFLVSGLISDFIKFLLIKNLLRKAVDIDVRIMKVEEIARKMMEFLSDEEAKLFSGNKHKMKIIELDDSQEVRKDLLIILFGKNENILKSFFLEGFFGSQYGLIKNIQTFNG